MAQRKKSSPGQEGGGGDSFTVLFTTLSLILLAFFIFMKTLSTIQDDKARRALDSIRRNFDWVKLGGVYAQFSEDHKVKTFALSQSEQAFRSLKHDLAEIVRRQRLGSSNDLLVEANQEEIRIRMSDSILFPPRVPVLSPRTFPVLDRIGEFIEDIDRNAVIEGHCDPSGGAINWKLSSMRAAAVTRYLDESAGLPKQLLTSRGLAHYHQSGGPAHMARRVEIVISVRGEPSS